jgi:HAD superfamily hydrolase (TIGR01509 family)
LLKDAPRIYPGFSELVRALHRRTKLGVVSGTWRENIETVLNSVRLLRRFEIVVAKEDVLAPKPAPDAYLLALEKLSIRPRSAIAIEDSPTGVAAARAAGLRVIAVGHRHPFGDWVGDAPYVSGFEPVDGLLKQLKL